MPMLSLKVWNDIITCACTHECSIDVLVPSQHVGDILEKSVKPSIKPCFPVELFYDTDRCIVRRKCTIDHNPQKIKKEI